MGEEVSNNDAKQAIKQIAGGNQTASNPGQREVYGVVSPLPQTGERSPIMTLQWDMTSGDSSSISKPNPLSFKDTFNPPVQKEKNYLPQVTVSLESEADKQAKKLQEEVETQLLEQSAVDENLAILLADLNRPGKTESNVDFFNNVNELRARYGMPPLEYDSTLEDQSEDNNIAMAQRGTVGHFAHGGYEVANWIGGAGGSMELATASLEGSSPHLDIILNRSITRMGAAGNSNYQTARFA